VAMMIPNYMQCQGVAEEMGCTVKGFHLLEGRDWAPDIGELRKIVEGSRLEVECKTEIKLGTILTDESKMM
jgi:hypothetical protein